MGAAALPLTLDPLRPIQSPGMGRGLALALIAHGLLLVALSAGVSWQRDSTAPAFEAELWAAVPRVAAPPEQAPPPAQAAPPTKAAQPPPNAETARVEAARVQRDADIAEARERARKQREVEKKQAEKERTEKAQRDQAEKAKAAQDKATQLKADKLAKAKAQEDAAKAERKTQQEEAKREALRQENLRRIQGLAGASGDASSSGNALQSAAPSASYGGRIKARIRPNIIYADGASTNPVAEVEVRTAPDGTILSRRLLKASGDAEWDKAVLRAIDKTETLPRDTDGRVPSVLVISFQPRE